MTFFYIALLKENIEDITMTVSYGHETLEIQFSDEDKSSWVCEMLYQAFAEFEWVASDDRITNVISDLSQLCKCQKNNFKVISQVFVIDHKSKMAVG